LIFPSHEIHAAGFPNFLIVLSIRWAYARLLFLIRVLGLFMSLETPI